MSKRYPGGVISKSAPVVVGPTGSPPEGGSAPGIWTLEQAAGYIKQGLWPKPILPRELYSWGQNFYGQLGLNDTVYRSSPVQVGSLTTWSRASGGSGIGAAIKDGQLWTWGSNNTGQLGQNDIANRSSPVQVGALTNWSQVSTSKGNNHRFCAAIKTDGTLWAWGKNSHGSLGDNSAVNRSSPVQIGSLTNWSQVSANGSFCVAIKTDGSLWSWGRNYQGQLGQNNTIYRSSPTQIGSLTDWSKISSGLYHCVAIKTNGTLWTWGYNITGGRLGQNDQVSRSSPTQVGALTTWSEIGATYQSTTAITTSGTLFTWGRNNNGQLGQNNTIDRSSPVQVGGLTTWSKASGGFQHFAAIKTDGTLWAWGQGSNGQLGDNSGVNRSSPVQIGSGTWDIASSGYGITVAIQK